MAGASGRDEAGGTAAARRPRVLLLQKVLPHYRVRFFQQLCQSRKFAFTLAYDPHDHQASLTSVAEPPGIPVLPLRNLSLGRAGESDALVYQLGSVWPIARGRFDAVIAPLTLRIASCPAALAAARLRGMPFVWWGHGVGPRASQRTFSLMLKLARRGDAVIFYDAERAKRFVEHGLPTDRAFVAPNSIDVEEIVELRQAAGLEQRHSVLYVGRLTPRKKVHLLLKAFSAARPKLRPGARLVVIGEGPERASLEKLAGELGIDDATTFTGAVYDQKSLAPWFNDAWASVSPGALGLSAVHSLGFGVPLIVARNEGHGPEISTIREGENGLIVPSDNSPALAETLLRVSAEPDAWQRLADAARNSIDGGYGLGTMVAAFEQALDFAFTARGVPLRATSGE